jgi:hypothetical protein
VSGSTLTWTTTYDATFQLSVVAPLAKTTLGGVYSTIYLDGAYLPGTSSSIPAAAKRVPTGYDETLSYTYTTKNSFSPGTHTACLYIWVTNGSITSTLTTGQATMINFGVASLRK